MVEML